MQLTKFVRNIEISVHPIITNHNQYVSLCMILSLGTRDDWANEHCKWSLISWRLTFNATLYFPDVVYTCSLLMHSQSQSMMFRIQTG